MQKVNFYHLHDIADSLLTFAVIAAEYQGKWIYCKHKQRDSYEMPGGHREPGENILDAAKRELFEETGAIGFHLNPICIYSVERETESYGLLCHARIDELGPLPESEIEAIYFFAKEPERLTYPYIQSHLMRKILENVDVELDNERIKKW